MQVQNVFGNHRTDHFILCMCKDLLFPIPDPVIVFHDLRVRLAVPPFLCFGDCSAQAQRCSPIIAIAVVEPNEHVFLKNTGVLFRIAPGFHFMSCHIIISCGLEGSV